MKNFITKSRVFIGAHKKISIISFLIIIVLLGYLGYKIYSSKNTETVYMIASVQKGSISESVSGTGQVSASSEIDLISNVSEKIVYIGVKAGDIVKKGKLLFSLNATDAQKTIRDAEINLESAKISAEQSEKLKSYYNTGLSTLASSFSDMENVMTGLNDLFGGDGYIGESFSSSSSKTFKSYLDKAKSSYYTAKKSLSTSKKLYQTISQSNSKEEIETALSNTTQTATLIAQATKDTYEVVEHLRRNEEEDTTSADEAWTSITELVTTINGDVTDLLSAQENIKNAKLDLKSSDLSVQQKENALQDAKDNLLDYYIHAPFDGTIASIDVEVGDIASGTLGTIITNKQIATISLNEVDIANIQIGQKATLTFDAIDDLVITGEVAEIDSVGVVSSGVVSYDVKINFDITDNRIKPGMSTSATIITNNKTDILVVPSSAIKSQGKKNYVLTLPTLDINNQKISQISSSQITPMQTIVEIGISDDTYTEIISGLKEGEQIVTKTTTGTTTNSATGTTNNTKSSNKNMIFGGGPM